MATAIPTPLQRLIGEVDGVHQALSDYSEALSTYLADPTSSFPVLDITQLSADELTMRSQNNKYGAVDTAAGAITHTVYKVAGVLRELGTRSMTKSMMYDLATQQAGIVGDEVRGDGGKKVAELRSTTPAQSEGT